MRVARERVVPGCVWSFGLAPDHLQIYATSEEVTAALGSWALASTIPIHLAPGPRAGVRWSKAALRLRDKRMGVENAILHDRGVSPCDCNDFVVRPPKAEGMPWAVGRHLNGQNVALATTRDVAECVCTALNARDSEHARLVRAGA